MTVDQTYTAEQIEQLTTVKYWLVRRCSICNVGIGFEINRAREYVAFDSSCNCTRVNGLRWSSWQGIADLVNRQVPAVKQRMIDELKGVPSDGSDSK